MRAVRGGRLAAARERSVAWRVVATTAAGRTARTARSVRRPSATLAPAPAPAATLAASPGTEHRGLLVVTETSVRADDTELRTMTARQPSPTPAPTCGSRNDDVSVSGAGCRCCDPEAVKRQREVSSLVEMIDVLHAQIVGGNGPMPTATPRT